MGLKGLVGCCPSWPAVGRPMGRPIKVKVVVVVPTLQYSVVAGQARNVQPSPDRSEALAAVSGNFVIDHNQIRVESSRVE